jgi:hypothetical protein
MDCHATTTSDGDTSAIDTTNHRTAAGTGTHQHRAGDHHRDQHSHRHTTL